MPDAPVPIKAFDYAAFIEELRQISNRAKDFAPHEQHYNSREFRFWRHTLDDAIRRINAKRYSVNTGHGSRMYRENSAIATDEDNLNQFKRDMEDTIGELDLIVSQFETYGDPKASMRPVPPYPGIAPPAPLVVNVDERQMKAIDAVPAKKELEPPEKITVYWLVKHMTIPGWGILGALLVGAYTVGVTVGAWPLTQRLLARWFGL
jgi:hypothetical protein